jgi:putative nucleotidyltransferase with HDIG domain
MFKIKYVRNILLASLSIAIILPLYNIFIAYPSFISALKDDVTEEAVRTASHLTSQLNLKKTELNGDFLPLNPNAVETVRKNFNLIKIKAFSPSGKIIYSTDPEDIGDINRKEYFHEVVARGSTYTKLVQKDTKSLEGQLMRADVVETYVPIMDGGRFLGAFEIYYDVTKRKERFDKLRFEASTLIIVLSFGLVFLVIVASYKASRSITAHRRADEVIELQLKRLNALRSIDMAITASLDLRVTLDVLLEQVTTMLNIDAASVLLLNPQTQMLEYGAGRGFRSGALRYTRLKLGEGNAGRAAMSRRMVIIPNLKEEPEGFERSKLFIEEDFVAYLGAPLFAKGQIKGVLELFHRTPLDWSPEWLEFLKTIAGQAAIAIDNATLFEGLQRSNVELNLAYDTTIEGWSRAMELRDEQTEGHTKRVSEMTLRIARELGVSDEEIVHMRRGALLHDIGKMGIPDRILQKPGPLTVEEWEIMKHHCKYAYEMLYPIEYLRPALDIPFHHHERWDGTGYPRGLKGEEIPLAARIFAVVDVWDALCSDRPYRPAWPKQRANELIRSLAGTHFEPKIVEVFLKMEW